MFDNNALSTIPVTGILLDEVLSWSVYFDRALSKQSIYESFVRGGIDHNNTTQGLESTLWRAWVENNNIYIEAKNIDPILAYSGTGVIGGINFAFDQNMRWACSFVEDGISKLSWYDTTLQERVVIVFDSEVKNIKFTMDDKRFRETDRSDFLLVYLVKTEENTKLYFRQQRDRFLVAYELVDFVVKYPEIDYKTVRLVSVGMSRCLRVQFDMEYELY